MPPSAVWRFLGISRGYFSNTRTPFSSMLFESLVRRMLPTDDSNTARTRHGGIV